MIAFWRKTLASPPTIWSAAIAMLASRRTSAAIIPFMSEIWYSLSSGCGQSAQNMAWDEALLEYSPALGHPVLRFYGWKEAAATFGYSQRYREVAQWTSLRPLIRRPTGGGLVLHDADWTYSLVLPPPHPWYRLKAVESYRRVHEWIQSSLGRLRLETVLSPMRRKDDPGQCFSGAEQFDLLQNERKIAGAAQRRNRHGLLIQGSVQPPSKNIDRPTWENSMKATMSDSEEKVVWQELAVNSWLLSRVGVLTQGKYSQRNYNERR